MVNEKRVAFSVRRADLTGKLMFSNLFRSGLTSAYSTGQFARPQRSLRPPRFILAKERNILSFLCKVYGKEASHT